MRSSDPVSRTPQAQQAFTECHAHPLSPSSGDNNRLVPSGAAFVADKEASTEYSLTADVKQTSQTLTMKQRT